MFWLLPPIILFGWCLFSTGWPLYRHWRQAKRLNLPILITPIRKYGRTQRALQFALTRGLLLQFIVQLPFIRVSQGSWTFRQKFSIHKQYGEIFVLVSPAGCEIYVADPKVAKQILDRRVDFPKPGRLLKKLEAFGRNLATVDGEEWQRHRRLTSKAFHEKTYRTVWDETCSIASVIFRGWDTGDVVDSTQADMATLSLRVLVKACFNLDHENDSMTTNTTNVVLLQQHISRYLRSLTNPLRGIAKQEVEVAFRALNDFITRLVRNRKPTASIQPQNDLVSSMLAPAGDSHFVDSEIAGNLFLFIFAGHETTAGALVYILHLLAVYPEWQDWAMEEVDRVLSRSGDNKPKFETAYPECKRLRASLYETLRLYGPVPTIVRQTANADQIVRCSDNSEMVVTSNMPVNINCMALHTNPDYWGEDCLEWNPGRWISSTPDSFSDQELFTMFSNAFFPWGAGPRVCPGQRFSQIEVVAVLLCLLRAYRVTIAPENGKSLAESRHRVISLLEASRVGLTLRMPGSRTLSLIRRR
ncbi:cytochrome P450 monooxygenase [Aspergillus pseudoustus]|uniref:Cytochrome P450 monooxygenase n=1 Tax=Aspergillus pseudoustus TaxID=1810923 RepID=A0ABR4K5D1_9EURO